VSATPIPSTAERRSNPDAVFTKSDLAALGHPRRAQDAIFRYCDVIVLPGYARPMITVASYDAWIEANTYRGDKVR
jgi:hypothetical protein